MKKCNKCFVEKPLSEYYIRHSTCKACRKILDKTWHQNNKINKWLKEQGNLMSDWLTIIKSHHEGIKQAFEEAIADPTEENVEHAKFLLNAHAIYEEAVIYPKLSENGIDDENLEREQTGAKEEIHYLSHHYDEPNISEKLQGLLDAILVHPIQHEEKSKFKKLYGKLTAAENIKVGKDYLKHYDKWCNT